MRLLSVRPARPTPPQNSPADQPCAGEPVSVGPETCRLKNLSPAHPVNLRQPWHAQEGWHSLGVRSRCSQRSVLASASIRYRAAMRRPTGSWRVPLCGAKTILINENLGISPPDNAKKYIFLGNVYQLGTRRRLRSSRGVSLGITLLQAAHLN